jgi:glutathione S-transferase
MTTDRPQLFSFRRCPYAIRARMALLVSRICCDIREVKLSAKPAALLAASPKATVPVLLLADGGVIDESLEIMRWALAQHDPEAWLARADETLIAANDGDFKYHLDRYKYPERYGTDADVHRAAGYSFLKEIEARLRSGEDIGGKARGLTDVAIMPFVRQFVQTDPAWFHAQALPAVQAWLARHLASPLFNAAMIRLEPWRPDDVPIMLSL